MFSRPRKRKKGLRATNVSVYFISVVSCIGCRGWFLWEDSCKDEFFDGDEEVRLEVSGFGGTMEF